MDKGLKKWLKDTHTDEMLKCKKCGRRVKPLSTSTASVIDYHCKSCGDKDYLTIRDV